jgi:O-methyltransferase
MFYIVRAKIGKCLSEENQMKVTTFLSKIFWILRKYFLGVEIIYPPDFLNIWNSIKQQTSQDMERSFNLYQLLKLHNQILPSNHAYIEFGVDRGASLQLICSMAKKNSSIYGLDSFGKYSTAIKEKANENLGDKLFTGKFTFFKENRYKDFNIIDFQAKNSEMLSKKDCKLKVIECYFPKEIKPDDLNSIKNIKFTFAHIDFDLYQSTIDVLTFLIPRLATGAIVLFDDYNFINIQGCKTAIRDYGLDLNMTLQTNNGQLIYFHNKV